MKDLLTGVREIIERNKLRKATQDRLRAASNKKFFEMVASVDQEIEVGAIGDVGVLQYIQTLCRVVKGQQEEIDSLKGIVQFFHDENISRIKGS